MKFMEMIEAENINRSFDRRERRNGKEAALYYIANYKTPELESREYEYSLVTGMYELVQ